MSNQVATGTKEVPLRLAKEISDLVNREWDDGEGPLLGKVSPVTRDLLKFWFHPAHCENRAPLNFHEGQKQAILNAIYLHEVLKVKNVTELYLSVNPELLAEIEGLSELKKGKHSYPKYAIKMATGTGKTWVMNALLIWQYLNAKYEDEPSGRFSKNFLIVAPGLIVYERLLDAYLGKENEDRTRKPETSDFRKFAELLIPPAHREEVFGFIQSSVVTKDEIGKKVTGEGIIAITNWHALVDEGEEEDDFEASPFDSSPSVAREFLPLSPGTTANHALETLDSRYLRGRELQFLADLPDLVVFNDEAHHIHEVKKEGQTFEVEWQKSLLKIAEPKGEKFIQIDFSATPYNQTGGGKNRTKHYFPHIIVDFDLVTAIRKGLVKTLVIDRRKEIATMPLDFKAEKEAGKEKILSPGQKLMLRAGVRKLKILEEQFVNFTKDKQGISDKHPKMFVICEDTEVAPQVSAFLISEGFSKDDIMEIHSNKKGEISKEEWETDKQLLFSIDGRASPKVIVSVLMLREGFDVNNICVIVPLRSSESFVLLEQIIGRGLRLMWREPAFQEIKDENRIKLLEKKKEPSNYLDILSIVEHPRFIEFYDDLEAGAYGEETEDLENDRKRVLGDAISVPLKKGYNEFDFFWPTILRDREENLTVKDISLETLEVFPVKLEDLMRIVPKDGERFFSEEVTVKTKFGTYTVTADVFTAKSYNEVIAKIVNIVSSSFVPKEMSGKTFPSMQVNGAFIAKLVDEYIRKRLFGQEFDPFLGNNWRVLMLSPNRDDTSSIVYHIIKNISRKIYEDLQKSVDINEAEVTKKRFSEITELRMRENFSIPVAKAIYERLPYPSNRGGLERDFIEFLDRDSKVDAFLKINETQHEFAHVMYIREDGLLAKYFPDFLVKIGKTVYIVETKAERDIKTLNVKQKRVATISWIEKINELKPEESEGLTWYYVILGEQTFRELSSKGASVEELLEYARMTRAKIEGTLGDFVSTA